MKAFTLEIVTPAKIAITAEVASVTIPGELGEFQILYNHAPLVSNFEVGKMKVHTADDKVIYYATGGGVVEVLANKVVVLAQSIERSDEIDSERAQQAVARAKQRLEQRDKIDLARAEASLKRGLNRLKVTSFR